MVSTSTFRAATSTSPWLSPPRSKLSTSGRCTTGAADRRIDDMTAECRTGCGKVVLPTLTPRQANGGERVHDRRLLHPCAYGLRGGLRLARPDGRGRVE